ncbi:MAG: hypothetical protein MUQ10_13875, partial [Anaerolineae bacterium]|nr:hypothetical protein [Anaerolineae bacterium]
ADVGVDIVDWFRRSGVCQARVVEFHTDLQSRCMRGDYTPQRETATSYRDQGQGNCISPLAHRLSSRTGMALSLNASSGQ